MASDNHEQNFYTQPSPLNTYLNRNRGGREGGFINRGGPFLGAGALTHENMSWNVSFSR